MHLDSDDPRMIDIALRKELIALGQTDRSIARALQAGHLARPRRGAYVDGLRWRGFTVEQQYAVRVRAALRQACADAVVSHTSALPFLDAPAWGLPFDDVHLTRTDGRAGRHEAGIQQHRGALMDGDVVGISGLDVTSPVRATLEVATMATVESSLVVLNHFLHRGDFTADRVRERFEAGMDVWANSLNTNLVLRLGDRRIESVGESRTYYFLWRRHFPAPEPQFEVYDGSVLLARLDFAFPELGIWLEFDGKVKYLKYRREGENVVDAIVREKNREGRVAELTGWRCVRITWADLNDPVGLERRIRKVIAAVAAGRRAS